MSDISESLDLDSDPYELLFDKKTRSMLFEKLHEVISLQNELRRPEDIASETNKFIDYLETTAGSIGCYRKFSIENQQRRRERIESIANHLDGIIDQLKALDRQAIEYVLMAAWDNPPPRIDKCPPEKRVYLVNCAENTAFNIVLGGTVLEDLVVYALNIRNAAKSLPKCIGEFPGASRYERSLPPPELGMAIELENLFYEYRIKFTVTNTGLAADCLRAVYQLSGIEIDRVDYWLKRARDSHRSSKNCS